MVVDLCYTCGEDASCSSVDVASVGQQFSSARWTPGAREITPGAREMTPGASEMTPGAREMTPGAHEMTPGAREMPSQRHQ